MQGEFRQAAKSIKRCLLKGVKPLDFKSITPNELWQSVGTTGIFFEDN
jgi:hypothetical protein